MHKSAEAWTLIPGNEVVETGFGVVSFFAGEFVTISWGRGNHALPAKGIEVGVGQDITEAVSKATCGSESVGQIILWTSLESLLFEISASDPETLIG
jgi:hypothetical protein